ncbi:unnamed protein product [Adineta ricciae]|uniref:Uncharacterized protein n=1 Tax=Adineta ricciae TaxID=249248 RepID=A0A813MFZ7_ADIRI|nr:unnamed protein product [Adineta ricciae]CAF1179756.1 unnamed protein product [Adineta ricciae]
MTQNNTSILSDVSTCLNEAMDSMFNNSPNILTSDQTTFHFDLSSDSKFLSPETLKLLMNKRKLASDAVATDGGAEEDNGNVKRLCSMNDHHQQEQRT